VRTQPALWRLSYASEFPLAKPANDPPLLPHDQDQQLIVETQAVISDRPQLVLINTGYGMRRWVEVADAAGLGHELLAVLESARTLAVGPRHSAGTCRGARRGNSQRSRHHRVVDRQDHR
jgi:hypothetical protein